jgi:hypothetical protein
LALPTDSNEIFLREVDENLRRDQLRDTARRYGGWMVAAVVLFLAGIGGWLYWQDRQRHQAEVDSEQIAAIYKDIGDGKLTTVPQRLETLGAEGGDTARATALFTRAVVSMEQGDRPAALATYHKLAADKGLPQPYRDLATIRATALEFDSLGPDAVVARLQPLTKAGEPWFGSAGELTGAALIKQGKKAEAGRLFAAIAADTRAPDSVRARAVQIAGSLGVDASASLSTIAQPTAAQ